MTAGIRLTTLLVVAATVVPAPNAAADPVDRLRALSARRLERWLREQVPPGTLTRWRTGDCPGGETHELPCVIVVLDVVSRDRTITLSWAHEGQDRFAYRAGLLTSPSARVGVAIPRLDELPAALTKAIELEPLACPAGTIRRERRQDAGLYEWCERSSDATRDGPARSWFSIGIYLMEKGSYTDGAKHGPWLECSRFERCRTVRHRAGRDRDP